MAYHFVRIRPFLCALVLSLSTICVSFALANNTGNADEAEVVLIYTSDMHGAVFASEQAIGLDRIAALRKNTPNALLLDAGDVLFGMPVATVNKGQDIITLMKQAGYFAMTLGNHEFSYDIGVLLARKAEAIKGPRSMPMLAANVRHKDGPLLATPYVSTQVDGVKVCVFGVTTPETLLIGSPAATSGLLFDDVKETALALVPELKKEGCSLVVALGHVGSEEEQAYCSQTLAASVPDIDVVIDGHSHREMNERGKHGNFIVSAGAYGTTVGMLRLTVDRHSGEMVAGTSKLLGKADLAHVLPDSEMQNVMQKVQEKQKKLLEERVLVADNGLDGDPYKMRTQETPLGNFLADAIRFGLRADMAIVNGGSVGGSLPKGNVTREDLMRILPFTDYAVSTQVTGKALRDILEHALSALPSPAGAFPQVSGLCLHVDPEAPAGKKLLSVTFSNGDLVIPEATYTLATNGFQAEGGDGYPHLRHRVRVAGAPSMELLFIDYLHHTKGKGYPPDAPFQRIIYEK